jgi:hypothetical protein
MDRQQDTPLEKVFIIIISKFPHYWVTSQTNSDEYEKSEVKTGQQKSKFTKYVTGVISYCWDKFKRDVSTMVYFIDDKLY